MPSAFDTELALDRLEARLARDLPAYLAAAAVAYARGTKTLAAAPVITSADTAVVNTARATPELRARARHVVRLIAPLVIEADPEVTRRREGPRTWEGLRPLMLARDAVSVARFATPYALLVRQLAGSVLPPPPPPGWGRITDPAAVPPHPEGWREPSTFVVDDDAIRSLWATLRTQGMGELSIERSATAHPRTFVIERGVRATIVVPAVLASPAHRFSVLHELGHAWLWLRPEARTREWPRALDEACAGYFAHKLEHPAALPPRWFHPAAERAAKRRGILTHLLHHLEEVALGAPAELPRHALPPAPPWALWHDMLAQEAYLSAEFLVQTHLAPGLHGDALAAFFVHATDHDLVSPV